MDLTLDQSDAADSRFFGVLLAEEEETRRGDQRNPARNGGLEQSKGQVRHLTLTKTTQAVVETVVESTMLFICSTRTLYMAEQPHAT